MRRVKHFAPEERYVYSHDCTVINFAEGAGGWLRWCYKHIAPPERKPLLHALQVLFTNSRA